MTRPMVMVTGGAPGVGKSSLVGYLAERIDDASVFAEEEILTADEFAELIGIWRHGAVPSIEVLDRAATAHLDRCRTENASTFIQDALLPYLPSLYAWGYDDETIAGWFDQLARSAEGFLLVQLHLSGDPVQALGRAAVREGPDWIDQMLARALTWAGGEGVRDLTSLASLFRRWDGRSQRLLSKSPWSAVVIDPDQGLTEVGRQAEDLLARIIGAGDSN